MKPYQQRVVDEKSELDAKLAKLKAFFDTVEFVALDRDEQRRLSHQHTVMTMYSDALGMRIAAFNLPETEGASQETKPDAPSKIDSDLEDAVRDQLISRDYAEELSAARDELAKRSAHMKAATDDDSLVGSCNCLTKTPKARFHKKGCKYRLLCERDILTDMVFQLKGALQDIADMPRCDDSDEDQMRYIAQKALEAVFPKSARLAPDRPPATTSTPDPDPRPAASITRSEPGDGPPTSDTPTSA